MRFASGLAGLSVLVLAASIWSVSFAQDHTFIANDRTRAQLLTLGEPGIAVALARDHVIEILLGRNSCSGWFQEADANAAATFASLKFSIESNGPADVLGLRLGSGEMVFKHPYSAKAWGNSGGNSVIILNAKGAFFVRATPVLRQDNVGDAFHPSGWQCLRVGSYAGDTLAAQITILLHEFGHVVGRIPDDSDELSGQSGRNTAEVLRFCHAQIKAAAHNALRSGP